MKCPKCGYHRQPRDSVFVASTECPACGIVYAKHGSDKPISAGNVQAVATPAKKRSPVHETSLRQARERVEMRLRNKKNMLQRDDLRNRTLERARLITDTVMRQRLEEGAGRQNRAEAALGEAGICPSLTALPTADIDALSEVLERFEKNQDQNLLQRLDGAPLEAAGPACADQANNADAPAERCEFEPFDQEADGQERSAHLENSEQLEHLEQFEQIKPIAQIGAAGRQDVLSPADGRGFLTARLGNVFARLMPVVAWLILSAGLVGAVLSWTTIGDVQAGASAGVPTTPTLLPLALLLGFAYLAIGVLGFAFFWVSSIISAQLKDIRRALHAGSPQSE
jgi:hypothetical protein